MKAANRLVAGRAVKETKATGAKYNAVGAWRCMFRVAVKDRHLVRAYETYLTGVYRFELTRPVPGVTEWCSTPVHRQDGDPYGVFQIEVPVGLPEGGWADPETIRKAIDLRCTSAEEDDEQRGDTETFLVHRRRGSRGRPQAV